MNNGAEEIRYYEEVYKSRCKEILNLTGSYKELEEYENFETMIPKVIFKDIIKRKNNRRNKRYRTKEKFYEMVYLSKNFENVNFIFGTIMPNDNELSLKEDTYIRRINKWLKENFIYSILNKDFTKTTEREHYHFIGFTTKALEPVLKANGEQAKSKKGIPLWELAKKSYTGGFEPTLEKIDLQNYSIERTNNYLLKLNNHSSKLGTKSRIRVIKNPICKIFVKGKNL